MGVFVLNFHTEGFVVVPCDRCLDDMEIPVDIDDELKVKMGATFSDENDIVVVPEEDGYINVAWFIYEFIALSLPMKHVHAPGKCNKAMMGALSKHLRSLQTMRIIWMMLKTMMQTPMWNVKSIHVGRI